MTILKNFIKRLRQEESPKQRSIPCYIKQNTDPYGTWSDNLSKIGEGAYGFIYKVQKKNSTDIAALKRIQYDCEDEMHDLLIEVDILNSVKHPNIINILDSFLFDSQIWLFLEFCSHGAVDTIVRHLEKPLNEDQIKVVSKYLLEALIYLHDNLIIHRDLKAGNILITENYDVKLVDFGVSARLTSENGRRDSFTGTPYWMAPEVINCETCKDYPYNQLADIWSFGITVIEMAEMRPPHQELNPNRVLMRIRKASPPTLADRSVWSESMHRFLDLCLKKSPEERKSAKELSQHDFVSKVSEKDKFHLKILVAEFGADVEEEFEEISVDKIPPPESGVFVSPDAEMLLKSVKEDSILFDEQLNRSKPTDVNKQKSPLTLNTSINTPFTSFIVNRTCDESMEKKKHEEITRKETGEEIYQGILDEVMADEHLQPSVPGAVFEVMYELDKSANHVQPLKSAEPIKSKSTKPPLPPSRSNIVKNSSKDSFSPKKDSSINSLNSSQDSQTRQIPHDKGLPLLSSIMNYRFVKRTHSVSLKENHSPYRSEAKSGPIRLDNYMKTTNFIEESPGSPTTRKWSSFTNLAIPFKGNDKDSPTLLEKVAALALAPNKFSLSGLRGKKRGSISSLKDQRVPSSDQISISFEDGKSPKNFLSSNQSDTSSTSSSVFRRQSTFRTTRKTRRFVVDGKPMVTTSTHIGLTKNLSEPTTTKDKTMKKGRELSRKELDYHNSVFPPIDSSKLGVTTALRNQELKEFRLASKQERRLEQDLKKNSKIQFEQLEQRMKASAISLQKEYETNLDNLSKQHKAAVEKAEAAHEADLKKRVQMYKDINKTSLRGSSLFKFDSPQTHNIQFSIDDINQQFRMKRTQLDSAHLQAKHALKEKLYRDKYALEREHIQQRHELTKAKVGDFFMLQRQKLENCFGMEEKQLKNVIDANWENLNADINQQYRRRTKALKAHAKQRVNEKLRSLRQSNPPLSSQEIKSSMAQFEEQERINMTAELVNMDRYYYQIRLNQGFRNDDDRAELSERHRESLYRLDQEKCEQMAQLELELEEDLQNFSNLLNDSHKLVQQQNERERAKPDKIFRMIRNQAVVP